jgi:MurNAc alpha-1-phosphate uridylyltransferase
MQPFSHQVPKVFLPFFGVPVIQWVMEGLWEASVRSFVVNVHHHASWMQAQLEILASTLGYAIRISDESSQLLGSAGGIQKAGMKGPFFIANADVLHQISWKELADCHARLRKRSGVVLTLALHPGRGDACYREILCDPEKELILGCGAIAPGRPFYTGTGILEPEALDGVEEGEVSDFVEKILQPAILQKKAGFYFSQAPWYDFGSPEAWRRSHFQWMEAWEHHRFSGGAIWQRRMQAQVRHAPGIWSDREGDFSKFWKAPCYWGLGGKPPESLGPQAVLYGEASGHSSGIGYGGIWQELVCD